MTMKQRENHAVDAAADATQERTAETVERLREGLRKAEGTVTEGASKVAAKTADRADAAVTAAGDAIGDTVESARSTINHLGEQASTGVEAAMTTAGDQISGLAEGIRQRAPEGKVGELATSAADTLDRGGNYLRSADVQAVQSDLSAAVRQRPLAAISIALGVGFFLARSIFRRAA